MNKVMLSKGQRFIQEKVMASILATKYENKQYNGFISLIKQARHDLFVATFQNTHSFLWRNFSKYVDYDYTKTKKSGSNRSAISFAFLMITLAYSTWVIPTLQIGNATIFSSLSSNQVPSSNTFFVIIFLIIGITDGVINRKMTSDKSGLVRKPFIFTEMEKMKISCFPKEESKSAVQKAKRAFKKLKILLAMRKNIEPPSEIKENPLSRKFFSLLIFWLIVHFLAYIHLVVIGCQDPNKSSWDALVEFYADDPTENIYYTWLSIRIFYLLSLCYIYIGVSQIHYGQEIFSSSVLNWNAVTSLTHTISDVVPFYREIGVIMDFLANKSSLNLRNKLTYNDVMYHFWTARKEEISRATTGYGYKPGAGIKISALALWGLMAVIILFGPLLPFTSIFNLSEPVYIKDASMEVYFRDNSGNYIGKVFETQINKQDHSPAKVEQQFKEFQKYKLSTGVSITQKVFEVLSLGKASETRASLDDRFSVERSIGDLERTQKIIAQGSLVFHLNIDVNRL
jgi:hypothetical protein